MKENTRCWSGMEKSVGISKVHCNLRPEVLEGLEVQRGRGRGQREGSHLGIAGGTQGSAVLICGRRPSLKTALVT